MKFPNVLKALAPAFNRLLGIKPGHFRHSPKQRKPSPAETRAAERLAAKLKANESIPSASHMTRQRRRAQDRRLQKSASMTAAEISRRNMKAQNGARRHPDGRHKLIGV